ncbi:MAG: hypothetical protein SVX43_00590 [Cyanobacteriota bacterium]|nr:hypothetical protein [Cyanobacteriota bacterium]
MNDSETQQHCHLLGLVASNGSSSTWGDPKTGLPPQPTNLGRVSQE